jgi:hypothetical protein
MSVSLRPDQQADLVFLFRNPRAMLLHEPGTGKTPTVCVNQFARWSTKQIKTVWVMPKSLLGKNKRELIRFTPFVDEDVAIVDGDAKKVNRALGSGAKVFLMGPDRFRLSYGGLPRDVRAVDVDEMHMCFKGGASQRTMAFLGFASRAAEVVIMTGTLIDGRLDTAWPAIHAIEPGYYPMGYRQFLNAHAILDEYEKPVAWRGHDRIASILGKHGIRRTFESVHGEKAVVPQVEWVEMHELQRAYYDQLEATAVVELDEVMIDGTMPGVNLIRARQILEHPESFPDPRTEGATRIDLMKGEEHGKLQSLRVHLEDHQRTGKPFIIFSAFPDQQKRIAAIAAEMGLKVGLLNSDASAAKRAIVDTDFVAGRTQGIVGSAQIASVGYNWQFWGPDKAEVEHVIVASMSYSDSDFVQGYRRTVREKRRKALRLTVLLYDCEVERRLCRRLEAKSRDANKVDPTREVLNLL